MTLFRSVERAKVRRVSFHALRHTHFTELLRAGVHPKIASERAGCTPARSSSVKRSEEPTSELQSLMRISYAVFCLKKNKTKHRVKNTSHGFISFNQSKTDTNTS